MKPRDLLDLALLAALVPQPSGGPIPWPEWPAGRDKKDQVFLALAHGGRAEALITGDGDILAMRDAFPGLIQTPDEWVGRHDGELHS